jgi:predicted NAD-dependent protein-ADP-ribosyltransferase YbiA (DUF1768 family)
MGENEVLVTFPNLGPENIKISLVKHWYITHENIIGDTVFFMYAGTMLSMSLEDYNKVFKVDEVIAFTSVKLPYGWLGNMSPYPIKFGEDTYRTTEALFQALRFKDNDIKALIREEKSPIGAKLVAKSRASEMYVKPLSDKDIMNMKMCLKLKLLQHPNLVIELLETGDKIIIEDVTRRGDKGANLVWGAMLVDGKWVGDNRLGKLWMELRKEFKK